MKKLLLQLNSWKNTILGWFNINDNSLREYRIVHIWGHGEWRPEEYKEALQEIVDRNNSVYGVGTHSLQRRTTAISEPMENTL